MALGKIVKLILSVQAIIGLILGIAIIVSPAFLQESGVTLDNTMIIVLGGIIVVWHSMILVGLSKLHE